MEPRRRRPAFRGYGVPEDEVGMLSWSWAAERLAEARNYWVSTTRPDGRPHAMPVWGVWLEDAFVFGSGSDSAKSRNLAANPEIVVHLESGDETVILEGRAEPVLEAELERRIDEAYARSTTGNRTTATRPHGGAPHPDARMPGRSVATPATPRSSCSSSYAPSPQGRMRGGAGSPWPSSHEMTGFRNTPIRSISASITSPGLR